VQKKDASSEKSCSVKNTPSLVEGVLGADIGGQSKKRKKDFDGKSVRRVWKKKKFFSRGRVTYGPCND